MGHLVAPHGGKLVDLVCSPELQASLKKESIAYPSIDLTSRQLFDLELIINGSFSPLTGFMTKAEYDAVVERGCLPNGLLWPIPVHLDIPEKVASQLKVGQTVALRDREGFMLAVMKVSDLWRPDKHREAELVYSTSSTAHPGVAYLLNSGHDFYVGGQVTALQAPIHPDFKMLRLGPAETRRFFERMGWRRVLAFETHKPLHKAHKEASLQAAREQSANIFLHPVVGLTHPGDIDHYTRVRCYEAIARTYPANSVFLAILPLAMRMAGPREALWHAIIRKNFGCSDFMVVPDHADPFSFAGQKHFYPLGAAQQYVADHSEAAGVRMVPMKKMVYLPARAQYIPVEECGEDCHPIEPLSGTELRRRLTFDLEIGRAHV